MIEIVFLGTGASVPSRNRNLASVWMQYSAAEGESMLFDCGEGTQSQMMRAGLSFMKINRIFITHWHADHWAGLIGLVQTMNLEKRRLPLHVYAPEAERFIDNLLQLGYWAPRFRIVPVDCPFEGSEISSLYKSREFEVLSSPARHSVPAVLYCLREKERVRVDIRKAERLFGLRQGRLVGRLKAEGRVLFKGKEIRVGDVAEVSEGLKVVYTGDTQVCENLLKISRNADVLIHDSTFESKDETIMHAAAGEAAETARKAGVRHLILTHFSRRYQDVSEMEKEARKIFPDTIAARDFLRVTVKKGMFRPEFPGKSPAI